MGARGEPGLQFVPNIFRRSLDSLSVPMGIKRIVQQVPNLGVPLKVGKEVDQREFDRLRQRGDGLDHIGADGPLSGRGLQNPATAARRRILGIDLALRRQVQEDRQDSMRSAKVAKLSQQCVEGLPFFVARSCSADPSGFQSPNTIGTNCAPTRMTPRSG